jgi:hypothetical protein
MLAFIGVLLSSPTNIRDCEMNIPTTPEITMNPQVLSGIRKAANLLVKRADATSTNGIFKKGSKNVQTLGELKYMQRSEFVPQKGDA